jgi:hypothetical protein
MLVLINKEQAHLAHRLPLRLVNGRGKCKPNRELLASELNAASSVNLKVNSRYTHRPSLNTIVQQSNPQLVGHVPFTENPISSTFLRVYHALDKSTFLTNITVAPTLHLRAGGGAFGMFTLSITSGGYPLMPADHHPTKLLMQSTALVVGARMANLPSN